MKCKECNAFWCEHRTSDGEKECVFMSTTQLPVYSFASTTPVVLPHPLRTELATKILIALVRNGTEKTPDLMAKRAVALADALINQLNV